MRKMHLGLAALFIGVAAMTMTACGEDGTGAAGCSADTDCLANEICHPQVQVCVQTCQSAVDCPDEAKTCAPLSATDTRNICKCTTDELCQGGNLGSSAVCSDLYEVCVTRCSDDTGCPTGLTCNTATGECVGGASACTPACGANEVCDTTGTTPTCVARCTYDTCGAGQNCNLQTGVCEAATTCSPAEPQPATCTYGQFCQTGGTCDFVPKPTCPNFVGSPHGLQWDPATSTGGVIYSVSQRIWETNTTFCPGTTANQRVQVRVNAYTPTGSFPTTEGEFIQQLHYVRTDGTEATAAQKPNPQNYTLSNNGRNVTVDLNFCVDNTFNQFVGGLHLEGGNELCFTATKP